MNIYCFDSEGNLNPGFTEDRGLIRSPDSPMQTAIYLFRHQALTQEDIHIKTDKITQKWQKGFYHLETNPHLLKLEKQFRSLSQDKRPMLARYLQKVLAKKKDMETLTRRARNFIEISARVDKLYPDMRSKVQPLLASNPQKIPILLSWATERNREGLLTLEKTTQIPVPVKFYRFVDVKLRDPKAFVRQNWWCLAKLNSEKNISQDFFEKMQLLLDDPQFADICTKQWDEVLLLLHKNSNETLSLFNLLKSNSDFFKKYRHLLSEARFSLVIMFACGDDIQRVAAELLMKHYADENWFMNLHELLSCYNASVIQHYEIFEDNPEAFFEIAKDKSQWNKSYLSKKAKSDPRYCKYLEKWTRLYEGKEEPIFWRLERLEKQNPELHTSLQQWFQSSIPDYPFNPAKPAEACQHAYFKVFDNVTKYVIENPERAKTFLMLTKEKVEIVPRLLRNQDLFHTLTETWQQHAFFKLLEHDFSQDDLKKLTELLKTQTAEAVESVVRLGAEDSPLLKSLVNNLEMETNLAEFKSVVNLGLTHKEIRDVLRNTYNRKLGHPLEGKSSYDTHISLAGWLEVLDIKTIDSIRFDLETFQRQPITFRTSDGRFYNSVKEIWQNKDRQRILNFFERHSKRNPAQARRMIDYISWAFNSNEPELGKAVLKYLEADNYDLAEKYMALFFSQHSNLMRNLLINEDSLDIYDCKIRALILAESPQTLSHLFFLKAVDGDLAYYLKEQVISSKVLSTSLRNYVHFAQIASFQDKMLLLEILKKSPKDYSIEERIMLQIIQAGNFYLFEKLKLAHNNLIKKLKNTDFSVVNHQIHLEQLLDICHLLQLKQPSFDSSAVLDFCIDLINDNKNGETSATLAKLICLLDSNKLTLPLNTDQVDRLFSKHTRELFSPFWNILLSSRLTSKSFDQMLETSLVIGIAKLLIVEGNIINRGLIPAICDPKSDLCTFWKNTENYLPAIKPIVELFQTDQEFCLLFVKIQSQYSDQKFDRYLQQALKPLQTKFSTKELKILILSALMFKIRQGDVGSCFSTAFAIQIQSKHPKRMLKDLIEILETGHLLRELSDGTSLNIPVVYSDNLFEDDVLIKHPLTKMWEFTLASLDTSRISKLSPVINIVWAVIEKYNKIFDIKEYELITKTHLTEAFSKHFTYLYDPSLTKPNVNGKGGWRLHYKNGRHLRWQLVEDLSMFAASILNILLRLYEETPAPANRTYIETSNHLDRKAKLKHMLLHLTKKQSLESIREGGSPGQMMKNYFGQNSNFIEINIKSNRVEDFVHTYFDIHNDLQGLFHEDIFTNLSLGTHCFSVITHKTGSEEQLPEIIDHSLTISDSFLHTILCRCASEEFSEDILERTFNGLLYLKRNLPNKSAIQFFRKLPLIVECATDNPKLVSQIQQAFDSGNSKKIFHLFDTNWEREPIHNLITSGTKGASNFNFGIANSLIYGGLTFYQESEDRLVCKTLNQSKWTSNGAIFYLNFGNYT